jgi:hypothetical protein
MVNYGGSLGIKFVIESHTNEDDGYGQQVLFFCCFKALKNQNIYGALSCQYNQEYFYFG